MTEDTIIKVDNISKAFHVGVQNVPVLRNISFEIKSGDFLIIFGPSGCGKSTLLHTVLGLEQPSEGRVVFLGKDLYADTVEDERSDFRKVHIGMVYQQANWIKALTVIENVAFPLSLLGMEKVSSISKGADLLQSIGMANWANYLTSELSSGQQQKVALARALVTNPEVIIADEPTGNLDFESGQELMQLLSKLNQDGKTVIMVTHDLEYLQFAKSAIKMLDGQLLEIYSGKDKEKLLAEVKSKRGNGIKVIKDHTDDAPKTEVKNL